MARALVVDDNAATRDTFAQILRLDGHDAAVAATATDGLRLGLTGDFDLILADFRLPDLDGLDLLRRLLDAGVQRPFVLMTGFGSTTTAFEAGRLGVAAYVEKPIFAEELHHIVRVHALQSAARATAAGQVSPRSSYASVALREIEERYGDSAFDVHATAASCGISREHLARVIHEETGRTFTQLLRARRMREARRLLAETSLRIKDIYQQVGLTSTCEFDHIFKQMWQVSPKIYRLICRRQNNC